MKTEDAIGLPAQRSRARGDILDSVFGHTLFLVMADLLIGVAAYLAAWLVRVHLPLPMTTDLLPQERISAVSHPVAALVASQVLLLYLLGLYDDLRVIRYREILALSFAAALLQMAVITSVFYFTQQIFPRTVILLFDLFNLALVSAWRSYLKSRLRWRVRRTLVVGESADSGSEILREIEACPWMGLRVVGLVVRQPDVDTAPLDYPVLGSLDEIEEVVGKNKVEEIIFVSAPSWRDQALDSLCRMQEWKNVRIAIQPSVYDMLIGKLRHVNIQDTPLIEVRNHPDEPFERFVKRLFDFCLGVLAGLALLPLVAFLAASVKIFSPGPVFYRQKRVGLEGRVFDLVKFRTMIPDAEKATGEVLAAANDSRVTPLGRFLRRTRLDELPQLYNVIKGDMSFVGPRPERPSFVADFERRVPGYTVRHKVKPGITGLAQVKAYYDTSPENKLRYDLAYIYNYGFTLDLVILLETLKVVLRRRGS